MDTKLIDTLFYYLDGDEADNIIDVANDLMSKVDTLAKHDLIINCMQSNARIYHECVIETAKEFKNAVREHGSIPDDISVKLKLNIAYMKMFGEYADFLALIKDTYANACGLAEDKCKKEFNENIKVAGEDLSKGNISPNIYAELVTQYAQDYCYELKCKTDEINAINIG